MDRHVDTVADKIGQLKRCIDANVDTGMYVAEAIEPRHQPGCGERRLDPDREHLAAGDGAHLTYRARHSIEA